MRRFTPILALSTMALCAVGRAQPAEAPATIPVQPLLAEPVEPASAATPVQTPPVQLEAIVVSGEKLGRKLAETTTSVSVFNGRNIEDQGDASLGDLLRRAANTTANEEGNLSIRGVSQNGAGGGSGSPLISVQLDGVTLDRTSQQGAADELFDVDQVEVLRGAQSTSQGRNALAGAVVINTREPTRTPEFRTRGVLAQRGARELAAAGGGPLGERFAFRLTGSYENDDGFITHQPDGDEAFARARKMLVCGKLAYAQPGKSRFDSLLTVAANRSSAQPDYNQEFGEAGSDPAQRRTSTVDVPTGDLTRGGQASLRNRLKFGKRYTVTAISAAMRTTQDYLRDFDGTSEDGGDNDGFTHGRNVTQELRLNLKNVGRFTGAVGLYGGFFRDDNVFFSNDVFVTPNQVSPVAAPVVGEAIGVELDFFSRVNREARNAAAFTEFDVALPFGLTATLGLRYDTEQFDSVSESDTTRADAIVRTPAGLAAVPLAGDVLALQPAPSVLPVLLAAGQVPTTNGVQRGSTRYTALLPKLGLRWAFTRRWSVFATYAEAYRAGGLDIDTQTGQALPYDPEYTRNYEIGARADYRLVDFTANAFYTDWRDQQVPVLRGMFFVTQNAARSRLYGAETSLGWRPVRTLRLQASAGVVDTEFLDYRVPGDDYGGNDFIFAPRFTGSVGATWRPLGHFAGLMATANLAHRTMAFTTPANDQSERSEARTLLDGRVGYERGPLRAYVFGRNLLDQDKVTETYQFPLGYTGAPTARGYAAYTAPRQVGVQGELRF